MSRTQTSNQPITSTNSWTKPLALFHAQLLSCAKSLSSALRPPPAVAAKSAAMIHASAVQVSNTSDAAAQPKHPQTNRGPSADGHSEAVAGKSVQHHEHAKATRLI